MAENKKVNEIKVEHCSDASIQKYEEEWNYLFNNCNVQKIRKNALFGQLRASRFRSLSWFLLLEILPEDSGKWVTVLNKLRRKYRDIKNDLECSPWNNEYILDDPLSQDDNSLWHRHFCDEELRSVIKQDVVRTFPGVDFFRKSVIQEIMTSILFIYARQHPIMCYRQGMHELLAPLLFVLHCDHQAMIHTCEQAPLNSSIKDILDPKNLEEDGYSLFVSLMKTMSSCYHINNVAPTATGYFPATSSSSDSPTDSKENENEVVAQLNSIRENLLQKIDPELCEHLKNLDITLPLFGIRWLRLLFGREFPLQDLLVLWDAIFSRGPDFKFVHCVVVAMLLAIRKQLLEGDYTGCLMYLMRYPINVDISYVIRYALHLQDSEEFPNPPIKAENYNINLPRKMEKPFEVQTNKSINLVNNISIKQASTIKSSKFSTKFIPKWDSGEPSSLPSPQSPERTATELKHAHSIMSLSRLKLQQYHKVLTKAIPKTEANRDAALALDGIQELCNLLTSRYYTQQSTEVEHAIEAGEVRPTELNLNSTVMSLPSNGPSRSKGKEKEMITFLKTEVKSLDGIPMADPTNRMM